ncbi:MAG: hypothetical protein D6776_04185, partial [Planctomycetota bacterium]
YELRRETAWILGAPDPDTVVRERSIPLEQVLATAPSATAFPGAATVCLLDHTISLVQSDGSRVDTVHQVWRVEAPAGIERYHTLQLPGEVLVLRTVLPDGSRWEPIRTAENAEILMPRLAPGAVIEAAYRQVLPASRRGLDTGVFFFGDPGLTEPFVRSRWELRLPRGLAWEQRRHAMPAPTVERRADGSSWLVWERRDVARREPEPLQPPPEQIVPWARIVTPPSWDDLAERLRDGPLTGLTKPSPELERAARELGGSDLPARERLERIVRYVRDRVRRPGGERQASRVLAEGAGWRLPVIAALCRAQGLRADLVAATLGPGFAPPRDPSLPSLEWFRDVLLRVELPETGPVWLTNSGRLAPIGYVPRRFEGGLVLALDPTLGVTFDRIPQAAEQAHESRSHLEITLSGLDAGIVLRSTVRGLWQLKERIARTPRARLATGYVAPLLSRPFPGFELETFDFPSLEKAGAPLVLHATGRVPRWLRPRAGSERVRLPHNGFEPLPLSRHFASLDERHFPLVFTDATVRLEEVEIRLGPDWRLERLPPGDAEVTEIGTLSLSYADRGDRILVRRRLSLHPGTVDPERYPRLREQLRRFDEAQAQRIVLRRTR